MKNLAKRIFGSLIFAFEIPLLFYLAGAFLMNGVSVEKVNELGYAKQQPYFYTDKNQEIIEGGGLIEVEGIGKVITYQDVYFGAIVISFLSLIFGAIIFYRDRSDMTNLEGLGYWMFGNCIVGAFLIALTTKANIPSTILFWLGVLSIEYARILERKETAEK